MKKIAHSLLIGCITLVFGACASRTELGYMFTRLDPPYDSKELNEKKLTYSKQLRCYKYNDKILWSHAFEKIHTREEALERLQLLFSHEKYSVGEKMAFGATAAYVVPVALVLAAVNEVALIPAAPYTQYKSHSRKKTVFRNYAQGIILLEQDRYREARMSFWKALKDDLGLISASDVYYKIAKTYDGEKNQKKAATYYREFLDYSIALYPDYFEKYDKKFTNDLDQLDKQFSKAEEKLSKF